MASLPFPDAGSRRADDSNGRPQLAKTATVFSDAAGTTLAEIYTDNTGTRGPQVVSAQVTTDSYGYLPLFWGPDAGVDRLYISVNGGPVWPIDADYNSRLDILAARVVDLEGGEGGGAIAAHAADTIDVHGIADTTDLETQAGALAKATTAQTAAATYTDNNLSAHAADTTSVHGIADTATLETAAGAQAKASAAQAAAVTVSLQRAANLSDLADAAVARVNLSLGDSATKDVGTTGDTVAAGNDPRLSDTRAPTTHAPSHASAGNDPITVAQAQVVGLTTVLSAKADLVDGKVPSAQIPAIALTDFLGTVPNEAGMLALSGDVGDWTIRVDTSTAWIITGGAPDELSSWTELPGTGGGDVTSVNGQTGPVVLAAPDVGAAPTSRTLTAGTGLTGGGDLTTNRTFAVAYGTSGGTAAQGNDSRIVGALQVAANLSDLGAASAGRTNLGLGNIDNTSDVDKPVSAATQAALNGKVSKGDLVINAKDAAYGAVGDGSTDDTAAIQAAINAVPTDSGGFSMQADRRGAHVYLPPGRYRTTGLITLKPGITLRGAGPQSTIIVNEGGSNHVLYFLGADAGTIDPICVEDLAVVQKSGVAHTSGAAIFVDGNGFGCTVAISRVNTYGTTFGIRLRDTYLSTVTRVEAYVHTNGFYLDTLCTSINFEGCYAAACTGSGFKIFGHYMTFTGCGSDSNTLDGYEVYYNGSATAVTFVGCGSEQFGRNGISCDRATGVAIVAPRLIASPSGGSAISLTGGTQYAIMAPVLSCTAANANPAIDNHAGSGAYPTSISVWAFGQATNYASLISNDDRVFHVVDYTQMGLGAKGFRLGPITSFDKNLQTLFVGATPAGSGGTAYGASVRPVAGAALTTFAAAHIRPEVNAAAATVSRVMGQYVVSPLVSAGTVTRAEGIRVEDVTAGGTGNANLAFGSTAVAAGNWNIHSASTRDSYFAGPLRLATTTGPTLTAGTGTPEGVVTAPVGSVYHRTDGGSGTALYVKESGSGNTGWRAHAATLDGSGTLDFPSIAAGAIAELTVTVVGAAAGDVVHLGPPATLEAGLMASARVSATDTVTIRVHNTTGGAVDPVSATWRVRIGK